MAADRSPAPPPSPDPEEGDALPTAMREEPAENGAAFPIVGVGVSAGG